MTAPSPVAGSARDDARDLQAGFVQPARKTSCVLGREFIREDKVMATKRKKKKKG
jgi:hypothetical protein